MKCVTHILNLILQIYLKRMKRLRFRAERLLSDSERNYSKGDDKSTRREREGEIDHERKGGRTDDKNSHRKRGTHKENGSGRKERRSGRDEVDEKSSRGRQRRSPSSSDRRHRSKRRSRSPQSAVDIRERDLLFSNTNQHLIPILIFTRYMN